MTAAGILLLALGLVWAWLGDFKPDGVRTKAKGLCGLLIVLGFLLTLAGIVVWLWRNMP